VQHVPPRWGGLRSGEGGGGETRFVWERGHRRQLFDGVGSCCDLFECFR
jgi:hypothetical protein